MADLVLREGPLSGTRIAVLIESDYFEPEIHFYQRRFAEEGAEVHFLTRLWGQQEITFTGHEWRGTVPPPPNPGGRHNERPRPCSAGPPPPPPGAPPPPLTPDVTKLPPPPALARPALPPPRSTYAGL